MIDADRSLGMFVPISYPLVDPVSSADFHLVWYMLPNSSNGSYRGYFSKWGSALHPGIRGDMDLHVEIHSDRQWSYANAGTRRPIVRGIFVEHRGDMPTRDTKIVPRITLEFPLPDPAAAPWTAPNPVTIEVRGGHLGEEISWEKIDLAINYELLGRLQDKVHGSIRVDIIDVDTDHVLATERQDLDLLAPNEFRQEGDYLEIIAAFVMPSDPYVAEILVKARQLLHERTGNSATEGYQSDEGETPTTYGGVETSRAYEIAHAVYDAMSSMGYDYSNPPGYFDTGNQRVRTPSEIRRENCATCLDSAVLMAACLAQAGLEPVLFVTKGHAFAGYFTGKPVSGPTGFVSGKKAVHIQLNRIRHATSQSQILRDRDYGLIRELLTERHIIPIETTTTTRSMPQDFVSACQRQNGFSVDVDPLTGTDDSDLLGIVVVKLARQSGVMPPIALNPAAPAPVVETILDHVFDEPVPGLDADEEVPEADTRLTPEERAIPPRIRQWMASLLDLGPKNPLLKVKPTQMMEFDLPPSVLGSIDDLLFTPRKSLKIQSFSSLPASWIHSGITDDQFEAWSTKELRLVYPSYKEANTIHRVVEREVRTKKDGGSTETEAVLVADLRQRILADLDNRLNKVAKSIIDKSAETMLSTGNSGLFLALGTLAWTEPSKSQGKPVNFCAPLFLYPVLLDGGKGRPWTIRLDPAGEVTPNYCLHEKLKRSHNLDLRELITPTEDDKGLDIDELMRVIKTRLSQAKMDNFAVQPRAILGVFDYATFRLWKDLRDEWKEMARISPVFKHLAYTANVPYTGNPEVPDPRLEPLMPIAADDSQKRAVQMALDGQSFRLEGPPGTGKSQTITNLLASCIAHNVKVLFVAEKQTALNAVKDRLDRTGLGKFSLNLHAKGDSDTRLRKNISQALEDVLRQDIDPADEKWSDVAARLAHEEKLLDRYRDSLHDTSNTSFSAWSAHEELLELGEGELVGLPTDFIARFDEIWPQVRDALYALEDALDLVPDPSRHPWRFSGLIDMSQLNFTSLTAALHALGETAKQLSADPQLSNADVTVRTLSVLRRTVALQSDGVLPDVSVLRGTSGFPGLVDNPDGARSFRTEVADFLAKAKSLSESIAQHSSIVSTVICSSPDRDHMSKVLDAFAAARDESVLRPVQDTWDAVAASTEMIPIGVQFTYLPERQLDIARRALDQFDSSEEPAELDAFIRELLLVHAGIAQHDTNIARTFIARTDLPNIELLLGEVTNANAFTRRSKIKALRRLLGDDALTADDRFLLHSLPTMLDHAKITHGIVARLTTRFPNLVQASFEPSSAESVAALRPTLESVRVSALRESGLLDPAPVEDDDYVAALRAMVTLTPLVDGAVRAATPLLPDGAPIAFMRPWEHGAFRSVRDAIDAAHSLIVREALGDVMLVDDVEAAAAAASSMLDLASRADELVHRLRTSVIPGYARDFHVWVPHDIDAVDSASNRIVALSAALTSGELSFVETIVSQDRDDDLQRLLIESSEAWERFTGLVEITDPTPWFGDRPLFVAIAEEVPRLLADAGQHNNYIELHRWQSLSAAIRRIDDLGLGNALPPVLARTKEPRDLLSDIRRSALTQAMKMRMDESNLDRFDAKVHEKRIRSFEKLLIEARQLLNQRIPGLAASRTKNRQLPSGTQRGAAQDLQRGLQPRRGEKVPIRDLIDSYGDTLADLMPCFLMSPDSVASLLPVGSIEFDLVVFDEASQVRTAHAVGAIGRGKAAVVVGDSRQMPPGNAFVSNSGTYIVDDDVEEEDEEARQAEFDDDGADDLPPPMAARDAESILSEFNDSDMPALQLLCHYRSKDEVLISFSNSYIYDEPMLTFPSPKGLGSHSLRYVHVVDGHFQRSKMSTPYILSNGVNIPSLRTNLREAEEIVTEVLHRLRDPDRIARRNRDPEREAESIIIVTFNAPQMKLITEMLRAADPDLADTVMKGERADDESERNFEPQLKIRNVENVQGDEAETVIFSVAFSKDGKGFLPLRFGPVTQTGGERRLNVAVTRAKREMIVYASFLPDEMDHGRKGMANEAKLLQQFLRLAHRGATSSGDIGVPVPRSHHIENIAAEMRQIGFEARTQLGLSSLRVDIALRRPGAEEWEFAIMVDDTCWAGRGSAFQREVLVTQILPAMGWKHVRRIWLPTWLNSHDEIVSEMQALFDGTAPVRTQQIDDPPSAPPAARQISERPTVNSRPVAPSAEEVFDVFHPFSGRGPGGQQTIYTWQTDPTARRILLDLIDDVIATEAPVEAERFARAVYGAFDFKRVSTDRIDQMISLVPRNQVKVDVVGRFVWKEAGQWNTWTGYRTSTKIAHRTVSQISAYEYTNALTDFVDRSRSLRHEDALSELAHAFGFQKITAPTRTILEKVMRAAVKSGKIILDGDTYKLP